MMVGISIDELFLGPLMPAHRAALEQVFSVLQSAYGLHAQLVSPPRRGREARALLHLVVRLWWNVNQGLPRAWEAFRPVAAALALAGGPADFGESAQGTSAHEAALAYAQFVLAALAIDMPTVSAWCGRADQAIAAGERAPRPTAELMGQLTQAHVRFGSIALPNVKALVAAMRVEASKASSPGLKQQSRGDTASAGHSHARTGRDNGEGDEGPTPLDNDPHRPPSPPERATEPERGSAAPLTPTERAVLAIIKKQRRGSGIEGKAIITALKKTGIELKETTLRRHIIPKLKKCHGVMNTRAAGGYLALLPEAEAAPSS